MYNINKVAAAILLPLTLLLAGCTTSTPEPSSGPSVTEEFTPEPTEAGPLTFGDSMTYPDGVEVNVSAPAEYTPSATAVGQVEGQTVLSFTFTLTNNSENPLQIAGFPSVVSASTDAESVYDMDAGIEGAPIDLVEPGTTVSWVVAYSVTDPMDVTLTFAPNFEYEELTWMS